MGYALASYMTNLRDTNCSDFYIQLLQGRRSFGLSLALVHLQLGCKRVHCGLGLRFRNAGTYSRSQKVGTSLASCS